MAKTEKSQRDFRRTQKLTDQHGRLWVCQIEISTGHPCSPLEPFRWTAPLIVPQQYFTFDSDNPSATRIDYDTWIAFLRQQLREYDKKITDAGVSIHGDQFDPTKPSREQIQMVGPKPEAVEPVLAARQGNKWILGFAEQMPDWAAPYFQPKVEVEEEFPDAEDEVVFEDVAEPFVVEDPEGREALSRVLDENEELKKKLERANKAKSRARQRKRVAKKPGRKRVPVT